MNIFLLSLVFLLSACAQSRVNKYNGLLESKVGRSDRNDVGRILGEPVKCSPEGDLEKCEYRTASAKNHPVPDVFKKQPAMGPDVSPYEHYDVLHLYYGKDGLLKEWKPVVILE